VNADVVRNALAQWNAQPEVITEEAFAEFAHPDMVMDMTSNVFNPATYEGFDGFRRFAEQVGEAWAEFRMEPEEAFEEGDVVIVLVRAVGKGRGSGVEIGDAVAMVCEVRDGKIASMRVEPDRAAALRLIGR
jgi:ketosteroid isomerase-like protein